MNNFIFRPEFTRSPRRVVIKLGSNAITNPEGGFNSESIRRVVEDVAALRQAQLEVIIVSSGAIQTGRHYLPNFKRKTIEEMQALSAIGQPYLFSEYVRQFQQKGIHCAQVLLTHDDLKNRTRYLNVRQSLQQLLNAQVVPILNENDCVSYEEITLGDNDHLAAVVARLMDADVLCLLSTPDGLFESDPTLEGADKLDDGEAPAALKTVDYDQDFSHLSLLSKSKAGRGGMESKLLAVRKVTPLGIQVILSTFKAAHPILRALQEQVGTFFFAKTMNKQVLKKSWLLTTVKATAAVEVDAGAFLATKDKASSLLPAGILEVVGKFQRGDCIEIRYQGKAFAVGLSEYSDSEVRKILGRKGHEILNILGYHLSDEVIHRDNLALKL